MSDCPNCARYRMQLWSIRDSIGNMHYPKDPDIRAQLDHLYAATQTALGPTPEERGEVPLFGEV